MGKHWSGTRSGWNARGGTDNEHLRISLEDTQEIRALQNSLYWRLEGEASIHKLCELVGEDYTMLFGEVNFPGSSIDTFTWKQITECYESAVERGADAVKDELTCKCPVCEEGVWCTCDCKICAAGQRLVERFGEK